MAVCQGSSESLQRRMRRAFWGGVFTICVPKPDVKYKHPEVVLCEIRCKLDDVCVTGGNVTWP
jgi:hypothetical protein